MHDAGAGRHDAKVVERLLSPFQERVALLVTRELELRVQIEGVRRAKVVHLHRVVDDQLGRLQRVDALRVSPEPDDAVAHGRQVDHDRNAGEVLQQDP